MAREGQQRVEVRPGVLIWMNEADRKAFEARQAAPEAAPIETAEAPAPEAAVIRTPRTVARAQPVKGRKT